MKEDGGASIDAAKLFNGQVELPRAPFFSLPCFLFPFTGVCAPLFFSSFSLFPFFLFLFFNFFPFLSFYSRKGDEGGRGCALSTCMLPLLVQSAIRVYATGTIDFVASPSWRRASVRFRDFESLLSLPLISDERKSREPVNGFNLELATVSFQIFKDL